MATSSAAVRRRLAVGYLVAQAVAVAGWWLLLAAVPDSRPLFAVRGAPLVALGAFAPGDLALVAVGSALAAWRRGRGWGGPLAWCVAGAMIYAATYTATTATLGATAPWGALAMVPAAAASLLAAAALAHRAPAVAVPPRPAA